MALTILRSVSLDIDIAQYCVVPSHILAHFYGEWRCVISRQKLSGTLRPAEAYFILHVRPEKQSIVKTKCIFNFEILLYHWIMHWLRRFWLDARACDMAPFPKCSARQTKPTQCIYIINWSLRSILKRSSSSYEHSYLVKTKGILYMLEDIRPTWCTSWFISPVQRSYYQCVALGP